MESYQTSMSNLVTESSPFYDIIPVSYFSSYSFTNNPSTIFYLNTYGVPRPLFPETRVLEMLDTSFLCTSFGYIFICLLISTLPVNTTSGLSDLVPFVPSVPVLHPVPVKSVQNPRKLS